MNKGIFCISIDVELLWGRKDLDYSSFIERTKKERGIIKKLLFLFKKYNIPVTWAVVGKLFEPGDKLWSGIDIIKLIKSQKNQEIGCHSYSHLEFTRITKLEAEEEIKRSIKNTKKVGVKLNSFVFPRNKVNHLDVLSKYGFASYRGPEPGIYSGVPIIYSLRQLYGLLGLATPPVNNPKKEKQILNIPGSMYFVSGRGMRRFIPQGLRFFKAKSGIDKAIRKKKIFHLWFHPVDFVDDSEKLFSDFEKILKYVDEIRKEGKLQTMTMAQIAQKTLL